MKTYDVYQYFGSVRKISNALGISRSAFYKWMDRGYIPLKQQQRIELLTKGALSASDSEDVIEDRELNFLPSFRYYDKKHGMCFVESIHFRKGSPPRITYVSMDNSAIKHTSFETQRLMQGIGLLDLNQKMVYEGDILRLKNGKKFIYKKMEIEERLQKLGEFKIIGNICK